MAAASIYNTLASLDMTLQIWALFCIAVIIVQLISGSVPEFVGISIQ
jgi:hypothetical protein